MTNKKNKTKAKAANVNQSGLISTEGCDGKIVYWDLSGPTDRIALNDALLAEGCDSSTNCGDLTQPALSLKNALHKLTSGRRNMVRPLKQRGAFGVVSESIDVDSQVKVDAAEARADGESDERLGEDFDYATQYKVWIDRQADPNGGPSIPVLRVVGADSSTAQNVNDTFVAERNALPANAFGVWLKGVFEGTLDAVKLRASGGVYFVPSTKVVGFEAVMRAIGVANSGHSFHTVPAAHADDTVAAVLAAVTRETASAIDTIEQSLDVGDLGKRALNSKQRELSALGDKLKAYDSMLGIALDAIRSNISDCDANIGDAILQAEQAKEAEKMLKAAS